MMQALEIQKKFLFVICGTSPLAWSYFCKNHSCRVN